uniref:COP9 signalosome complex subunit 6 n=1 Tax=Timema bartmani TaxID=61472 RepID=A0A7R9FA19_9NEOP|nr:unnamed protein product [Timema bartmani]
MEFLGWYTTGDQPNDEDLNIHRQICQINESPILLKLNPQAKHSDLPVTMYESVIDLVEGEATMLFVELHYTLATEEAERIGVDHVARMSSNEAGESSLATEEAERIGVDHVARMSSNEAGESSLVAEHLTAQHSAIKMLHSRVRLVLQYVRAVQAGELPRSHEILREAYSLSHRLPVMVTDRFRQDFYNQCNDVGLMTYLGTITKGCNDINQFVNKFNILYDRQGMGRRMRGLFF